MVCGGVGEMNIGAVSIAEAARLYMVSESTIEREIRDGRLRKMTIRGRVRIPMQSLEQWQRSLTKTSEREPADVNPFF